ncbi:DNA mismatch repair endonuclease MutL [Treponema sp. HNW]|uniref:DNA mismatch repair endonuclease MutL n=1 Tax=Treponema sp. HNW TaxID=3116654 RepID=UPI003D0D7BAF
MNAINTAALLRPVKQLEPDVARKIAAGEVIDRPAAVLREFLDNAVDAGADKISAELEEGGISLIRVADNGCGMTKADLEECARAHATSKIVSDTDLESLSTLGFRGEALASVSAVSRLEITSSRNGEAWKMSTEGAERRIEPASLPLGTTVVCRTLFDNFPARRRFLKRPQAENLLCKQTFIEKSLPFPDRAFRLISDGKIRLDLPAGQSLSRRFCAALDMGEKEALFYEIHSQPDEDTDILNTENKKEAFSFAIVLGETSVYRSDRKLMYVFVNGRRVQEYALLQAMDYGAEAYFPNGTHPAACLFLTIDSSLVDFNIHPAKKEVRFKDIGPVHRSISSAVRNFYKNLAVSSLVKEAENGTSKTSGSEPIYSGEVPQKAENRSGELFADYAADKAVYTEGGQSGSYNDLYKSAFYKAEKRLYEKQACAYAETGSGIAAAPADNALNGKENAEEADKKDESAVRYVGTALGVFLIAEKNDDLYLVDQHAGHERILFERFMESAGQKQALLIPLVMETPSDDDDSYLESLLPELEKAGFTMHNCGSGRWEVETVPIKWHGGERDLQSDLLDKRTSPEEIIRSLAATSACRAAVKDGHILDPETAQKLLDDIFALKDPHCPHGRPVWTRLSKEDLFRAVRRTR